MVVFFFASFLLSLVATPLIRNMALSQNLVAMPSKDRWHKKPTALFGGVAIYLAMAFPLVFSSDITLQPMGSLHAERPAFFKYSEVFLWFCMSYFFFLGLWDDLRNLPPHVKLTGQIIGAAVFAFAGFRLNWFHSLTLDTMVTMIWIVGIVNAFNLIDNMDGLCAGTGIIVLAALVMLLPVNQVAAICLAGALAGFLWFNFNPASIFMGDCGSMLVGFVAAATAIQYSGIHAGEPVNAILVPIIIMAVPIMDTLVVTFVRILSGRKPSVGGRDHTSHRLVVMGFSEREAVGILYSISLMAGITAFFFTRNDSLTAPAIIIPFSLTLLLVMAYIARIRVYKEKQFSLLRDKKIFRILTAFAFKWQTCFVVLDFFLVAFAYYLAYRIRFDNPEFVIFFNVFLSSLPVVIVCKMAAFAFFDIYRLIWRYLGFSDILTYIKACITGSLLSIVAVTYFFRFESFSKGVFVIDFMITLGLLAAVRGSFRLFTHITAKKQLDGARVLIYGADHRGELCLKEIMASPEWQMIPVGLIDRDPVQTGRKIAGFRVMGTLEALPTLVISVNLQGIVLAGDSATQDEVGVLKMICRQHGMFLKQFHVLLSDCDIEQELI